MAELGEVAPEWQCNPPLEEVGHTAETLGRSKRQDVALLEVGMRGIHDERNTGRDIVAELLGERVVARLGIGQSSRRQIGLGRLVKEIDVGTADDAPFQLAVLDLVLAEGEELGMQRDDGEEAEDAEDDEEGAHESPHPLRLLRPLRLPHPVHPHL